MFIPSTGLFCVLYDNQSQNDKKKISVTKAAVTHVTIQLSHLFFGFEKVSNKIAVELCILSMSFLGCPFQGQRFSRVAKDSVDCFSLTCTL
jgi:hypothetical protein